MGTVLVCAMLSAMENTERNIVVTLSTRDNTGELNIIHSRQLCALYFIVCSIARAGLDYIGISSNETFDSGSLDGTVRCANITLLNGSQSRENLNFTVTLTTSDPDVTLRRGLTNVAIRGIYYTVDFHSNSGGGGGGGGELKEILLPTASL